MSKKIALRGVLNFLAVFGIAWLVASCASAPPKVVEKPPVETPAPVPETIPGVEPVSAAEFQTARDAIAEAVAAEAERYAPDLLKQASDALSGAEEKAAADPEAARTLLKTSVEKAHQARDAARDAKDAERKALLAKLDKEAVTALAEAEAAGAPQLAADLYTKAQNALALARSQVEPDPEAALKTYRDAIDWAHQARQSAAEGAQLKALLDGLEKQALGAIAEAEEAGAAQYASDLLGQAQKALSEGRAQRSTSPDESQKSFRASIDWAHQARDTAHLAAIDDLDRQAQAAIAEAEAADADRYQPGLLGEARQALARGRTLASSNPTGARTALTTSIEKAHAARDGALVARTKALLDSLDQAVTKYRAFQPEKWDAEASASLLALADAAKAAVTADFATGRPEAEAALAALDTATTRWTARLAAAQDLRARAQKALEEAESVDAFVWVPDLVESANDAFFVGTGAWKKYRIDAAEESWNTALFEAQSAAAKARAAVGLRQTEQLMLETMKKLEDASGKTIVDPNDNIIPPEPWDGKKELEKLKKKPVSVVIPADGSVVVLGDKQRVTYLDEAKDQWTHGVVALEAGDLILANESFLQAQKLIETYLSMAVDKVYTVRLIPDRRDSLWRISEYEGIYDTPWMWPKIWKRNQKLIQNPDLIYPGWQLIIPPQ